MTFQIDAPEPYTYTADVLDNANAYYVGSLTGPGGASINLGPSPQSSSGVLQPGVWTFNEDTKTEGPLNQGPENYISIIKNARLTVLPEPATSSLLGIGVIALSLRARRRALPSLHA